MALLDSVVEGAVGGLFGLANSALNNYMSYENAVDLANVNKEISKDLADYSFGLQKEGATFAKGLRDQSVVETPGLIRAGLVGAGYNPILAVNSAAGQPFSQQVSPSVPSSGGAGVPSFRSDILGAIAAVSAIRQNDARTELIKAQTDNTGWVVKSLSRSEAAGLGASFLSKLGINLHSSKQETFLVAYNTRTGKWINLGDTSSGLGVVEPSSADDVGEVEVSDLFDVKLDKPRHHAIETFPKGRKHN